MIMQVPKFILVITVEHEIHHWKAIHQAAGLLLRWKDHARVEFNLDLIQMRLDLAMF